MQAARPGAAASSTRASLPALDGSKLPLSCFELAEVPVPKGKGRMSRSRQEEAMLHALAGSIAGCISRFVVQPIDVIKIRFQVQLEPIAATPQAAKLHSKYTGVSQAFLTILREEGIKGLWRGTVPGQLLTIPYTAVQFVTLHQCKHMAEQLGFARRHPEWAPAVSFVSGALAGAAGTVASYPFDLLRTTLAAQGEPKVYASMTDAARGIVRQHGVQGLYRGLGVTLLEIMPYAALQFGLYDVFMKYYSRIRCIMFQEPPDSPATGFQSFMCGLAAGSLAKLGSHPLDVAKKRFQVAGLARSTRYGQRVPEEACRSLAQVVHGIWVNEGMAGLYKGVVPSLIKAAPAAAVTFAVYELVVRLVVVRKARAAELAPLVVEGKEGPAPPPAAGRGGGAGPGQAAPRGGATSSTTSSKLAASVSSVAAVAEPLPRR